MTHPRGDPGEGHRVRGMGGIVSLNPQGGQVGFSEKTPPPTSAAPGMGARPFPGVILILV